MSDLHYFRPEWICRTDQRLVVDICIYGATSAGVMAAIAAARHRKTVVLLQPGKFVGGLTTAGLGNTDYGRKAVVGGLSREFYNRIGQIYGRNEEFKFEPHVAAQVIGRMLAEHSIDVRLCQFLANVEMRADRIRSVTMLGGLNVTAAAFIDATYEGDLMAKAGVSYRVGRESNEEYDETYNGIQVGSKHQFSHPVDPYVVEGDPASGLLPGIVDEDLSARQGQGDNRVQAYNFRVCMTEDPSRRLPWTRPDDFDRSRYELLRRWLVAEKDAYNDFLPGDVDPTVPTQFNLLPVRTAGGYLKTDTNNHGPVSSDFIGANHDWPEASYQAREHIFQAHVSYQRGHYWFIVSDESVPARYREAFRRWGLASDEFPTSRHWPPQLYVRESRRLLGEYVVTEHDCLGTRHTSESVGMGSYGIDSHNCSRFVQRSGGSARVMNEGDVQVKSVPFGIAYGTLVPRRQECTNLIVPVCISATHIAYGSARMEPVFMILGHSAGLAASMAVEQGIALQDVSYSQLRRALLAEKQVLELAPVPDRGLAATP